MPGAAALVASAAFGIGYLATVAAAADCRHPAEYGRHGGTHADYKVYAKGLFGRKDVTREASGVSLDRQVASRSDGGGIIRFTGEGTTQVQFHYGGHIATATATATASPDADKMVSLELTPAGPIDLPLGQMERLQAFANYGDGRRVQVPSERLKWSCQEKAVPGLELYRDNEVVGAVGRDEGRRRAAQCLCHVSAARNQTMWPSRASLPIPMSSWRSTSIARSASPAKGAARCSPPARPAATWN